MIRKDLLLVGLLVMTLALMAVPLSQSLVDALLALNISLAVVMLMVAIYLRRPSDFATFPSVILIATTFRLALSIGTTRLILSDADAGQIVETFGAFVASGSIAIGLVIFLIITVVQFLVITKGAERVAEVGARFALDALPGKQMSIDAEMRAGNLDAEEGRAQRALLDKDSQFFGAMDGAMKFVKGDAIAGLIIICINLVGGVIVGISLHGITFGEAVGVFSLLTIGDGLVAQLPALLMSLCAGIMVTRVSDGRGTDLGTDIAKELVSDVRVPTIAAAIIFSIGLIPGFPTLFFAAISLTFLTAAYFLRLRLIEEHNVTDETTQHDKDEQVVLPPDQDPSTLQFSDRFTLSLSLAAINGINLSQLEESLLSRFWALYSRRGVRFPRATIIEQADISDSSNFTITLDEVPLMNVVLEPGHVLLSNSDLDTYKKSYGEPKTPNFRCRVLSGHWVPVSAVDEMSDLGMKTMSHEDIITYVTFRLYEHNLGALFSADVLEQLMDAMRAYDAATMASIEEEMNMPSMLKMFRYLVEDGVPLRPVSLVISSLHYWIHNSDEPTSLILAECLRASMKRQLCHSIAQKSGVLGLALLDPSLEILIRRGVAEMSQQASLQATDGIVVQSETADALLDQIRQLEQEHKDGAYQITLVISADLRRRMRNFLAANELHIPVLAPHEISTDIPTFPIQVIKLESDREKPSRLAGPSAV